MTSPRGFGLPHLSEDAVAAFADGVLSAAAASRARRHCSECLECADAVRVQREAAMMLRAAQAPPLPSGLLDRLAGLPMSAPLPPPWGGLPTVLDADGVAMFVAHDARNSDRAERDASSGGRDASSGGRDASSGGRDGSVGGRDGSGGEPRHRAQPHQPPQPPQPPQQSPRPAPRRGAVPVTVLASAAAVVAAGTFGGHASTLAADTNLRAPVGAANAVGALTAGQPANGRSAGSLTGAGLLSVGGFSTSPAANQRATVPLSGALATSVSVAPALRTAHRSSSRTAGRAPATAEVHGRIAATP